MKRFFRAKGFTLIELLVVIAIISILAMIMVPVIGEMRERARSIKCKSHLRALQTAAMSYAYEDGNNYLPACESYCWEDWSDDERTPYPYYHVRTGWVDKVDYTVPHNNGNHVDLTRDNQRSPYHGDDPDFLRDGETSITNGCLWEHTGYSMKTYLCPTFDLECNSDDAVRSYTMNSRIHNASVQRSLAAGTNAMNYASRTLLFTELLIEHTYEGTRISDRICDSSLGGDGVFDYAERAGHDYTWEAIPTYHSGKGNAVFLDGHVETLDWTQTYNAAMGNM